MDYFKQQWELAQKQAAVAAEKAKEYLEQAEVQSKQLLNQVSENTKVLVEQASTKVKEQTTEVGSRLQKLSLEQIQQDLKSLGGTIGQEGQNTTTKALSADDRTKYGITDEVIEQAKQLTYSTFRDYGGAHDWIGEVESGSLPVSRDAEGGAMQGGILDPWQVQHATFMLQEVHNLYNLRFVLCPSQLTEQRFWEIYFSLMRPYTMFAQSASGVDAATDEVGQAAGSEQFPGADRDGAEPADWENGISNEDIDQILTENKDEADFSQDPELEEYLKDVLADDSKADDLLGGEAQDLGADEDLEKYLQELNEETDGKASS